MSLPSSAFPVRIPTLTDGVVTLRGLRPEDSDEVVRAGSEAGRAGGELYRFAIEAGGEPAGAVNLRPLGAGLAEIDYAPAAPHRGREEMTHALRLALEWGFQQAGIEVVHWKAPVGSWAGRRVAWSVGFQVSSAAVAGLLEHEGQLVDGWLGTLRRGDPLDAAHPWLVPERITGRSVVLRPHGEQDVPRMVEACRDPETAHWLSQLPADYGEPQARQHLERILAEHAAGTAVYWAVADPQDDHLLAELALFVPRRHDPQGEIGYWCHPEARGRGVTTEGVRLAARHALLPVEEGGLGLVRVLLRATVGNAASQRVAEKAGFTRSGLDRGAFRLRDGSWHDDVRFDLLAEELPAVR